MEPSKLDFRTTEIIKTTLTPEKQIMTPEDELRVSLRVVSESLVPQTVSVNLDIGSPDNSQTPVPPETETQKEMKAMQLEMRRLQRTTRQMSKEIERKRNKWFGIQVIRRV